MPPRAAELQVLRRTTIRTQRAAGVSLPATRKVSLAPSFHLLTAPRRSGSYLKRPMSAGPPWQTTVAAVRQSKSTRVHLALNEPTDNSCCLRTDQYALCPAGAEINEECFHKHPLEFASELQTLRYIYVNDTRNRTEVQIPATRVNTGTIPKGSTCPSSFLILTGAASMS